MSSSHETSVEEIAVFWGGGYRRTTHWRQALIQEIEGLVASDTFTISELPPDRKALTVRSFGGKNLNMGKSQEPSVDW